ncbi:MAG: MFS transporter [Pseudomonadota bacterium]
MQKTFDDEKRAEARSLLLLLSVANFAIGFGAFIVVAILTPLGDGLGVRDATAGWTLTAYALAYAVGSPLGVALTGGFGRRKVLASGLGLFGLGALACALAPGFELLLAARAVMALGGGLVTPVTASVALVLVPEAERGKALATVFGGLAIAQALGVPVGAWMGYAIGWRETFFVAALLALPMGVVLWVKLPKGLEVPVNTLGALASALSQPKLVLAVGFTVFFLGGNWVIYTYFGPLFEARLGIGGAGVSVLLFMAGLGAILGNMIGGRLTDTIGPQKALTLLCLGHVIAMPMMTLFPFGAGPVSLAFAGLLAMVWSLLGWSFMVPQQARLAFLSPSLTPVLLALNAAGIYLAASVGATVGGSVLTVYGFGALGPVGVILVLVALSSLFVVQRMTR